MSQPDIIIRNGKIVDGTKIRPAYQADIVINNGIITQISKKPLTNLKGIKEIDATGRIVSPGWVDCHTHLDAQITFDPLMRPVSTNGITTVVFGNCGCGFAPCVPEDRNFLIEIMEGVEDIPKSALEAGMDWQWETFPQWLDYAETLEVACDFSGLIAHGALRTYVMGERGADHLEETSESDRNAMAAVVQQALEAGAIGFASNRAENHQDMSGNPIPGTYAKDDEVLAIARGVHKSGGGIFEVVSGYLMSQGKSWNVALKERELFQNIATAGASDVQIIFNIHPFGNERNNDTLAWLEKCHDNDMKIWGCTSVKAIGVLASMESNINPFLTASRTYLKLSTLPRNERVKQLLDPQLKKQILEECFESRQNRKWRLGSTKYAYPMIDSVGTKEDFRTYEPQADFSIDNLAKKANMDPIEYQYDHFLKDNGRGVVYLPTIGYGSHTPYGKNDLNGIRDMMMHKCCLIGLADSGAHVGAQTDSINATYLLSYWVRDRQRLTGLPGISLEEAVYLHTMEPARICGYADRGTIEVGMKADINVIDLENLKMKKPYVTYDILPSGAKFWTQDVEGYDYTICNGVITMIKNKATGKFPGRLVRNPRTKHVRDAGKVSNVDVNWVLSHRGKATRPLIGRGDLGGQGASAIGRRFRKELAEAAKEMNLQMALASGGDAKM